MAHITLDITDTPAGVTIRASGPLHDDSQAAWVARSMVDFAQPIFAGGKPVLLGGEADPVQAYRGGALLHLSSAKTVHADNPFALCEYQKHFIRAMNLTIDVAVPDPITPQNA
jgi:hypothetical protein